MALGPSIVWEVRTTGNDSNGGGFAAAATGTDWSQQDAAQGTGTNLTVDGTTNTKVNPDGWTVSAADIGNTIQITTTGTGAAFTTGFYQITAVTIGSASTQRWTLDRSPAAINSAGASWSIGGCLASVNKLGGAMAANNRAFVKSGSYTSTQATFAGGGSNTAATPPGVVMGYYQTRGDIHLQADGTYSNNANRPVLTAPAGTSVTPITCTASSYCLENLIIDANSQASTNCITFSSTNNNTVRNCKFTNWGNSGSGVLCSSSVGNGIMDCEFTGSASGATAAVRQTTGVALCVTRCYFHDIPFGAGVSCVSSITIVDNLFANITQATSGHGVTSSSAPIWVINNTFYNITVNCINFSTTTAIGFSYIRNNLLSKAGGFGIVGASAAGYRAQPSYDGNAFWSNTSGNRSNMDDTTTNKQNGVAPYTNVCDLSLTGDPFTNAAGGDFTLNNNAGGGALLRGTAQQVMPGASQTGYLDFGCYQSPVSGGLPQIGSMLIRHVKKVQS